MSWQSRAEHVRTMHAFQTKHRLQECLAAVQTDSMAFLTLTKIQQRLVMNNLPEELETEEFYRLMIMQGCAWERVPEEFRTAEMCYLARKYSKINDFSSLALDESSLTLDEYRSADQYESALREREAEFGEGLF